MRTKDEGVRTIAGMDCICFERAAEFLGISTTSLTGLIRKTRRSRTRRNVPCIQLGGQGSRRWFPVEELKAWVTEKI